MIQIIHVFDWLSIFYSSSYSLSLIYSILDRFHVSILAMCFFYIKITARILFRTGHNLDKIITTCFMITCLQDWLKTNMVFFAINIQPQKSLWKHFFRQIMISTLLWCCFRYIYRLHPLQIALCFFLIWLMRCAWTLETTSKSILFLKIKCWDK